MSTFVLKVIAIVCMIIDHITVIFVPKEAAFYLIGRGIGRLAFPIFAFLIVEGYFHTKNLKKYMIRLGIFALISEVPFDLAFTNKVINVSHQNIFFTLFIGLVVITLLDKTNKKYGYKIGMYTALELVIVLGGCIVAIVGFTDYSICGVLTIVMFYLFRGNNIMLALGLLLLNGYLSKFSIQTVAAASIIPIWFYNGKKGPGMKYFFYGFYPGHLLILYLIHRIIG